MEFDLLLKLIELINEVIMKGKIFLDKEKTMNLTLKFHRVIIVFLLLFSTATLARQQQSSLIRVPEDYPSIQAGINAAADGDTVLVADSTYYENINFKGKAITVASYFIMNGDTNHIANTVINGSQSANPDSGSVVYFISGEDTNSVLYGFTVSGGSGTQFGTSRGGGGIFSYFSGPRISWNRIENNSVVNQSTGNTYGGGVYTGPVGSNTTIIIEDNIIRFNRAEAANRIAFGGGICVSSNGKIMGNEINNNDVVYSGTSIGNFTWSFGGGISCFNQTSFKFVTIKDNLITYNRSSSNNVAYSAGLDLIWTNSDFSNNTILNNIVSGTNANAAAGMRILLAEPITNISNNTFSFNDYEGTSCTGGGLSILSTDAISVQGNRFESNNSTLGGGIYISNSSPIIKNNLIVGNEANSGGGIRIFASTAGANPEPEDVGEFLNSGYGSALMDISKEFIPETNRTAFNSQLISEPQIINNTISGNTAISVGGGIYSTNSQGMVMNSILWGDAASSGPEIYVSSGSIEVRYCDIQGGWPGEGNIDRRKSLLC
jgi:hypothetical protein